MKHPNFHLFSLDVLDTHAHTHMQETMSSASCRHQGRPSLFDAQKMQWATCAIDPSAQVQITQRWEQHQHDIMLRNPLQTAWALIQTPTCDSDVRQTMEDLLTLMLMNGVGTTVHAQ